MKDVNLRVNVFKQKLTQKHVKLVHPPDQQRQFIIMLYSQDKQQIPWISNKKSGNKAAIFPAGCLS